EIVGQAIEADPELRFQTARALHDVLEKYLDGDRDLELRRTQSEDHAKRAEAALARSDDNARSDAGREIGRALGLDPANQLAMRTLMRMLTEMPAKLPAAAQAEVDRAWHARRNRTLRLSTLLASSILLYTPFILWMGVRNWTTFSVWLAFAIGAPVSQLIAAR